MHTTFNSRGARVVALMVLLVGAHSAFAQPTEPVYSLTGYVSGGFVRNVSTFDISPDGLDRTGLAGSLRVMWKPEHLLRVGLEMGLTHVYTVKQSSVSDPEFPEFGTTNVNATLNAWPFLIMFSMSPIERLDVYLGGGFAIMASNAEAFGATVTTTSFSGAGELAVAYMYPVSELLSVGCEVRWLTMEKYDDNDLGIHLLFAGKFLEW